MKKKFIIIFILLITSSNSFAATGENDECIKLLTEENKNISISQFDDNWISKTTNDWLIWVDFAESKIFEKQTFTMWEKSQISKKDIYKIYDFFGIDLSQNFFFDKEINTYSIEKNWEKIPLSCSYTETSNINWELKNLKKWDITIAYTWIPEVYNIEEKTYEWKKWKKITIINKYKDRLGKKDVMKVETTYLIPENNSLNWYYNLYELSSVLENINSTFSMSIENTKTYLSHLLKETYNKNWIKIEQINIEWTRVVRNDYGIKSILVNWMNFFNDYAEFKRHQIFINLLENNSPIAKDIYILESKWDESTNSFLSPKIDLVEWVLFLIWDVDNLDKNRIDLVPYYLRKHNLINNSLYSISQTWIDRRDFINYIDNNIYAENSNTDILEALSNKMVKSNFEELKNEHKIFKDAYSNEIEWKENIDLATAQTFYNKYGKLFKNEILSLKEISIHSNDLSNPTDNNESSNIKQTNDNSANKLNNEDLNENEEDNNNILFIIVWILSVIVIVGLIIKKMKKSNVKKNKK